MPTSLDESSVGIPELTNEVSISIRDLQTRLDSILGMLGDVNSLQQSATARCSTQSDAIGGREAEARGQELVELGLDRYSSKISQVDAAIFCVILRALWEESAKVAIALVCLMPAVQKVIRSWSSLIRAPTWLLEDNIQFEDFLGRSMSLPFEHFRHWTLVHAKLKIVLKHTPGESVIRTDRHQVFGQVSLLSKDNWDALIFPGAKVVISVEMDFAAVDGMSPCCGSPDTSQEQRGWKFCEQRMFKYQVFKPKASIKRGRTWQAQSIRTTEHLPMDETTAEHTDAGSAEARLFRRVHFNNKVILPFDVSVFKSILSSKTDSRCCNWSNIKVKAQDDGVPTSHKFEMMMYHDAECVQFGTWLTVEIAVPKTNHQTDDRGVGHIPIMRITSTFDVGVEDRPLFLSKVMQASPETDSIEDVLDDLCSMLKYPERLFPIMTRNRKDKFVQRSYTDTH